MLELNEDNIIFLGTHLSGIASIGSEFCAVVEDGDFILVFALDDNDEGKLIKQIGIEDVKRINIGVESSNKKSMISRGIVGGLLAGPWGAFLGALSANLDSKCTSLSIIETIFGDIVFESAC